MLRMWDTRQRYFRTRNPDVETLPGVLRKHGYTTVGLGKVMDNRNHVLVNGGNAQDCAMVFSMFDRGCIAPELCTRRNRDCSWDEYMTTDVLGDKSLRRCGEQTVTFPPLGATVVRTAHLVYNTSSKNVGALHDNCLTKIAISKLEKLAREANPFFLAVGWKLRKCRSCASILHCLKYLVCNLAHMPWVMPDDFLRRYDGIEGIEEDEREVEGFWSNESGSRSRYSNAEIQTYDPDGNVSTVERVKGYLAATSFVDDQIGLFVDAFDRLSTGVVDNTILIFWSDHGFHLGDNGLWGKWTLFEQATKTPFAIVPPGDYFTDDGREVKDGGFGSTVFAPVESVDILPTVLEMCGIQVPNKVSGTSLVPLLFVPSSYVRAAAVSQMWSYDRWHRVMGYSIRSMHHRLVLYTTTFDKSIKEQSRLPYGDFTRVDLDEAELYDYTRDGDSERVNRFRDPKYANIAKSLVKLWNQTVSRHWAGLITVKPPDHVASAAIDVDEGKDEANKEAVVGFLHQFESACIICTNLTTLQSWQDLVKNVDQVLWNMSEPSQIEFVLKDGETCSSTVLEDTKALFQVVLPRHIFDVICAGDPPKEYISVVEVPTFAPSSQPTLPVATPSMSPPNVSSTSPTDKGFTLAPSVQPSNDEVSAIPAIAGTTSVLVGVLALFTVWCLCWPREPCGKASVCVKMSNVRRGLTWKTQRSYKRSRAKMGKSDFRGRDKDPSQPEEHPLDPASEARTHSGSSNGSYPTMQVNNEAGENYRSLTDRESPGKGDEEEVQHQDQEVFSLARSMSKGVDQSS